MRRLGWFLIMLALATAGCLGANEDVDPSSTPGDSPGGILDGLSFTEPQLIDDTRAGGEPVIAMTHEGTLIVSSHPGWTHAHPNEETQDPPEEAVTSASGESYIWRSTDGGQTWEHVGLPVPGVEVGPRGATVGVSDPDLTVTEDNRIFYTDLYLAEASVGWSHDDGRAWLMGNPIASQGVVDRQWLASSGDTVYFTANYFTDRPVLASEDGVVWERRGQIPGDCGGDIVASPHDGTLFAGCGTGVAVSEDDGETWEQRMVPDANRTSSFFMTEPAVDGAGNVWMTWEVDESTLLLAGSPDKGESWPWIHDITQDVHDAFGLDDEGEATMIWPWVSAGSEGRVAVSVYASPTSPPSDGGPSERAWSVVSVAAFDADAEDPTTRGSLVAEGIHEGPVCQSGTTCQVNSLQGEENSDRRLGDFFETTIGHDGRLYVAYADTTRHDDDVVSHAGFAKQVDGPSFLAEGDDFVPTQG